MAKTTATSAIDTDSMSGLVLFGTVVGRTRKTLEGKNGKAPRNIITLNINTGAEILQPERWSDSPRPSDTPEMGAKVALPVKMVTFATQSGTRCTLQWGNDSKVESF